MACFGWEPPAGFGPARKARKSEAASQSNERHRATEGRADEEMIFYAQARGIARDTAIRRIVEGFFANVYDRITIDPVRETLRQAVAARLA